MPDDLWTGLPPFPGKGWVYLPIPVEKWEAMLDILTSTPKPETREPLLARRTNPLPVPSPSVTADPTSSADNQVTDPPSERDGTQEVTLKKQGKWTPSMIEAIRPEVEAMRTVKLLFDLTAVGRHITVADLLAAMAAREPDRDTTANHVAGQLSGLSKASRRIFGRTTWPLSVEYLDGKVRYYMHPTIARWWKKD